VRKNACAFKKRVVCACAESMLVKSVFLCAYVCVRTLVKIPSVHWDEKYMCV
jgi:hypothetical protein